jgi:hypothetical protein
VLTGGEMERVMGVEPTDATLATSLSTTDYPQEMVAAAEVESARPGYEPEVRPHGAALNVGPVGLEPTTVAV